MVYHYWSIVVDPGLKTNVAYRAWICSDSDLFCNVFVIVCISPWKIIRKTPLFYMNEKETIETHCRWQSHTSMCTEKQNAHPAWQIPSHSDPRLTAESSWLYRQQTCLSGTTNKARHINNSNCHLCMQSFLACSLSLPPSLLCPSLSLSLCAVPCCSSVNFCPDRSSARC